MADISAMHCEVEIPFDSDLKRRVSLMAFNLCTHLFWICKVSRFHCTIFAYPIIPFATAWTLIHGLSVLGRRHLSTRYSRTFKQWAMQVDQALAKITCCTSIVHYFESLLKSFAMIFSLICRRTEIWSWIQKFDTKISAIELRFFRWQ